MKITYTDLYDYIENKPQRSAWEKGVTKYALEFVENMRDNSTENYIDTDDIFSERNKLQKILLHGAANWNQYSEGGCALIYNGDIAARLCTPSELEKTLCGGRKPNSRETWLDVQARALSQAANRVHHTIVEMAK